MRKGKIWSVIVASFSVLLACLAVFLVGRSNLPDALPVVTPSTSGTSTIEPTIVPTEIPAETPTVTPITTPSATSKPNYETMLKQGWMKDYELLHYEEQKGELYDYATFVFRLGHRGGILFRKAVAIFEKEDAVLKEMVYIDPEDSFTLSNLGDNYIPVKEMDVNFDGKKDILIFKGSYGKNGYEKYACYLGSDDGITYCPSFEEICDPAISIEKKIIQGAWRNNIASRTGLAYQFIDGEFVNVEMLTWTERQDENENDYNEWVLERLVNGKFSVIETFSDKGMSETEKEDLRKQLESFGSYAPIRYYESDHYYKYLLQEAQQEPFSTYQANEYVIEKGTVYDYAILLLRPQDSNENYIKLVAVIDQGAIVDVFSVEIDGALRKGNSINEVDVNFDGEMDVLVSRGIFGTLSYDKYTCYLGTKEGRFVYCPSFDEILNPEVDTEKKFIRSWSRDTASTHYGYIYQFMDGAFVKTEEIQSTFGGIDGDGEEFDVWTVKQYIDGQLVVVETLSEARLSLTQREDLYRTLKKYDAYHSFFSSPVPKPSSKQGLFKDFKLLTYEEQKGEVYDYATLILLGEANGDNRFMKIVAVFRDELLIDILYGRPEEAHRFYDIEGNLIPVQETDVNFDGKTDLLIYRGSFGNAGYKMYDCYFGTITGILGTVTKFEYCSSFEEIVDPVVDMEKQIIQSAWQNHVGSRTGVVYQFIDGTFVDVEHLTWTLREDENGNEYNEWVLERLVGGKFTVVETYSEKGMTQTEKAALRKQLESLDSYAPIGYYEE